MATTTPNYAWVVPTSSDLVAQGAVAIETLGDSVDASLWNSGFGQAGKNKIINGDFSINQRSFTSTTTTSVYMEDRWQSRAIGDGTTTHSIQTFTAGSAPVSGYEGTNYHRIVTTGQTSASVLSAIAQRIEGVRTFAGQTATISFWAKAASGTPNVSVLGVQVFGSGGSTAVNVTTTKKAISTSWVRYSFTLTIPSVSGKTIGSGDQLLFLIAVSAGSDNNAFYDNLGIQTGTFDFWGVQVEYGSYATPFQTASGGSPQSELAMCQRYYEKSYAQATAPATATFTGAIDKYIGVTVTGSGDQLYYTVTKRTAPTVTIYSPSTGTSARVWSNSLSADQTITGGQNGESAYSFYWSQTSAGLNVSYHFVASAEL